MVPSFSYHDLEKTEEAEEDSPTVLVNVLTFTIKLLLQSLVILTT